MGAANICIIAGQGQQHLLQSCEAALHCPIIGRDLLWQHLLNIRSTACSEKSSAFTGTISLSMVPAGEGD